MTDKIYTCHINTPLGYLKLRGTDEALVSIHFMDEGAESSTQPKGSLLEEAAHQLNAYFNGKRSMFELPLSPEGTTFQQEVWEKLSDIPYGQTITYSQLAQQLGDFKKVRAVGTANGKNPLPIVVPCHRVIGANDKLTGYAGGVERKRWLLQHEGAILL